MCSVAVKIPDAVMYDTKQDKKETSDFVKRSVAVAYYLQERVSLGYCAEIAGMSKEDFIRYLGQQKISIFHFDDKQEYLEELNNA